MMIIGRNVRENYVQSLARIREFGVREDSRAGPVMVVPGPVLTATTHPTERVLVDPDRDANPFFHFFEALWMLSGRADAVFLDRFVKDFGARFAEPGGEIWGAYGWRWRTWFAAPDDDPIDQLEVTIRKLRTNPSDRRVVIGMWDPNLDLLANKRDIPCNTHIYPRIHDGALDLTVCCRSNDIIWGAMGANIVHFSFLQEYLAGRLGVGVGYLYQFSNNWHIYLSLLEKLGRVPPRLDPTPYEGTVPIGDNWDHWDADLDAFFDATENAGTPRAYRNRWFATVVTPMWLAHWYYGEKNYDKSIACAKNVAAPDWRRAAVEWLERRRERHERKIANDVQPTVVGDGGAVSHVADTSHSDGG